MNDGDLEAACVVIAPRSEIIQTDLGDMDEENAARYISYRMRREVKPRTLREWRSKGIGPKFCASPGGRIVWYRETDIDVWIERELVHDPLQAA